MKYGIMMVNPMVYIAADRIPLKWELVTDIWQTEDEMREIDEAWQ